MTRAVPAHLSRHEAAALQRAVLAITEQLLVTRVPDREICTRCGALVLALEACPICRIVQARQRQSLAARAS